MDRLLLKYFWNCGDNEIIEFALIRSRLNRQEKEVICLMFDECYTQEQIAEKLGFSPRHIQEIWYHGADKLLAIPWVKAYALDIKTHSSTS